MPTSTNANLANIKELSDQGTGGTRMGLASTDLIGFLGATPITQRAGGTDAPAIDPTVSTSALVASIQSIAVAAASLANANAATLAAFGLTT